MKIKQLAIAIAGLSLAAPAWLLAAGEQTGMAAGDIASFESLDTDGDGYISAEEAKSHEGLYNAWENVDANADNRVDQAEFSAFEESLPSAPAEPGMETQPGMEGQTQ